MKKTSILLATLGVLALGAIAPVAQAVSVDYETVLTGAKVVPAVTTTMTGNAKAKVNQSKNSLQIKLQLENGQGVTSAGLYCGTVGQNGPQLVSIYNNPAGAQGSQITFETTVSNIPANSCSPAITNIAELDTAFKAGRIYIVVKSKTNPNGELRGQFIPEGVNPGNGNGGSIFVPPTPRPPSQIISDLRTKIKIKFPHVSF